MKTYTKNINNTTYTTTLFTAKEGLDIARQLLAIVAAATTQGLNVAAAVDKLIESDSDLSLTLKLLSNTLVEGKPIESENFNQLFTGKLGEYIAALIFVTEVNFTDFFCTIKEQMEKLENPLVEQEKEEEKALI